MKYLEVCIFQRTKQLLISSVYLKFILTILTHSMYSRAIYFMYKEEIRERNTFREVTILLLRFKVQRNKLTVE